MFRNNWRTHIVVMQPADDVVERVIVEEGRPFLLHPGQFALGSTLETVTIPGDIVARIEGKSSLARYRLLGSLFDEGLVDRVVGFVAPVITGGAGALSLVGGSGAAMMADVVRLSGARVERIGGDVVVVGWVGNARRF